MVYSLSLAPLASFTGISLGRNKTLPDVQRLDLAYVSCAAGPARPDGELKRNRRRRPAAAAPARAVNAAFDQGCWRRRPRRSRRTGPGGRIVVRSDRPSSIVAPTRRSRRQHRRRSPELHRRPDQAKPTSASAPIARAPSSAPNLRTTIPRKRNVDVGQQPQRRPAGRCRSVCLRARWNRRPSRARVEGSEQGKRTMRRIGSTGGDRHRPGISTAGVALRSLSVLRNLAIVGDDPVAVLRSVEHLTVARVICPISE